MKFSFILLFNIALSSFLYSQGTCELFLKDAKLSGSCENSYFTFFDMSLSDSVLDSATLFNQLPLKGNVILCNEKNLEVGYELTNRAGFPQILFKANPGWFTMDNLIIRSEGLTFNIDHDPDVPVAETDLRIIRRSMELLKNKDSWHKNDDRDCEDDIQKNRYSLFCALQSASIEIEGEYNHRNAIMQKIRHTIVEMFPNRKWEHRLRDFNNMPETDFKVLMDLLNRVENEVIYELDHKK